MTPAKVVSTSLILFVSSSIATSLIGLNSPLVSLNEGQILYLYSTSAQVLAGIYGLTLTGFIFFRNELSREEFEDNTLTVAVESLKDRYFKILIFITALSIFTLMISNLVISAESSTHNSINTILMNIAQSSFFVCLLSIAYFIFDVIAPKRIEKESKAIQQKVDPTPDIEDKGTLEDFLTNYNKLENIIREYFEMHQSQLGYEYHSKRGISIIRLARLILQANKIDQELFNKIRDLISLRNSIIHGAEPIVSKRMVDICCDVLQELETILK
ncbi:hypothetical protein [Serratia aquatilis]|uniref:Apea-like HEPN domain-containing protein n=1 Tax=Serratia aquatilis TaxID=1737515 RepID=A0ABV6EEF8_9GAMM